MRWLRSLHVQLFLWAVIPVTFVIIAISFTGVYAHQQAMRDFVVERDRAIAQLVARSIEDGIAHGVIGLDGSNVSSWIDMSAISLGGTTLLVDGSGRILSRSPPAVSEGTPPGHMEVDRTLARDGGSAVIEEQGRLVMVTYVPVRSTGWTVIVREPVDDLIGPLLRFPGAIPVVAAGAGLLSLVVFFFGWWTIVRPLQRLARAAEQVSWTGDVSLAVSPSGGVQEIRDLYQAVAQMVDRIRGYEVGVRDYLAAVTRGQEAERARLARELHDGPVQALIALGQRAEMAQRSFERGQEARATALLRELIDTEQQTVQDLRRLIGALRPIYLEDLGFIPALEMLARRSSESSGVEVRLDVPEGDCRLPADVELAAYRIAQEALNNALQHAHARRVVVRVRCVRDELFLSVSDDGVGFEMPDQPSQLTRQGHYGLLGMRERAAQLDGALEVRTAPHKGTTVIARLPSRRPAPQEMLPHSAPTPVR